MVAIVDSGSTKTDWVILDDFKKVFLKTETIGFNPNFINRELIAPEIQKNSNLMLVKNSITKVFFYGSGCGVKKNCETIKEEVKKENDTSSTLLKGKQQRRR